MCVPMIAAISIHYSLLIFDWYSILKYCIVYVECAYVVLVAGTCGVWTVGAGHADARCRPTTLN